MTNSATQPREDVPAAEKALLSALLWLGTGSTVHQVLLDPPACPLWWTNWIFVWQENSGCHWLQHGLQHCLPNILRAKLRSYGLDGCKTRWVNKWVDNRASRVAVTKLYSASWLASSWVPQEPLLGPVLLAHLAMKYTVVTLAADIKLHPQYTLGWDCHPEGPRQAGGIDQHDPHKVQQQQAQTPLLQ